MPELSRIPRTAGVPGPAPTYRVRAGGVRRTVAVLLAGLALTAGTLPVVERPARAADCVTSGPTVRSLPWAQEALRPERVWPFARGAGQRVAVVDTGIDAKQPQLASGVAAGTNVTGHGDGQTDCAGHGTQVAGVIAARRLDGVGFRGMAPSATLLPVAIVPTDSSQIPDENSTDPALLAKGINWAVSHKATIVTLPLPAYRDSSALQHAVGNARRHNVLVVAAVGDIADKGDPTPYPASYDGVLGVGALGRDGDITQNSQYGTYVDLVAPGGDIVTTQPGEGMTRVDGTAFAAGFVSGIAALVWSFHPELTADQLVHRLEVTASPGGETPPGPHYGWGIANPYHAAVGKIDDGPARALPKVPPQHYDRAAEHRARQWTSSLHWALLGTGAGVGLALLAVAVAVYLPRARRRRWTAGLPDGPHDDPEADMPSVPVHLFKDEPARR